MKDRAIVEITINHNGENKTLKQTKDKKTN